MGKIGLFRGLLILYGFLVFVAFLFCDNVLADEKWFKDVPHTIIVYPGFNDDGVTGVNLVGIAELINPNAQVVITITRDSVRIGGDSKLLSIRNQQEAESLLRKLGRQGIQDFIINIDMDIGLMKFISKRDKEVRWATEQSLMWSAAFKSVFEKGIMGSLSHSFGNKPASECILNGGKIDYAIMASPGAKRSYLNKIAERIPFSRLLVLTAEGDFHGPVHWDGLTNFDYVILEKTKHSHTAMVNLNNLKNPDFKYKTNIPNNENYASLEKILKTFPNKTFRSGNIPVYSVSPDPEYPGKSMTEAETLTETVHEKHKALIAGKGSEADLMYKNMVKKLGEGNVKRIDFYKDEKTLQLEARRFGADVILGVKESKLPEASGQKVGGVWIDPKPYNTGKGGSEIKKGTINSRPSNGSLSWPIEIPKE